MDIVLNKLVTMNESPVLVKDHQNKTWCIMASQGNEPDYADGDVTAVCIDDSTEIKITKESGIYESADASCCSDGDIAAAFTQRKGDDTRICLGGIKDGKPIEITEISDGFGRHEAPRIAVNGSNAWAVWNSYINGASVICARNVSKSNSQIMHITPANGRCYKPFPIFDESGRLYLFYESFFDNRYHIMVRVYDESKSEFTSPVEIGLGKGNNQAVSVCILDGYPLAVWENSDPLYKGYVFPPFPDVTIPAFGHGWRINTVMAARRVQFANGSWQMESLVEAGEDEPVIHIDEPGFCGAPKAVCDSSNRLSIIYTAFVPGKGMRIRIKTLINNEWVNSGEIEMPAPQRIPSGAVCNGDGNLLISQLYQQAGRVGVAVHSIDISSYRESTKRYKLSVSPDLNVDESLHPNEKLEISNNGETLKVYWGDLHMHSNISHCSLHQGFHATELEEKYRFCRDVGNLDFAMDTDHDNMTDFEWMRVKRQSGFHNRSADFVAFTGYEYTSSMMKDHENFGHRNVLFLDDDAELLRIRDPRSDTPEKLWSNLNPERSITIPHHPACREHLFNRDHFNSEFDRLVEIFQVRGSDEYYGSPMNPLLYGRSSVKGYSIIDGLNRGYRFGFTSGGEHEGVGVTAVLAKDLSRQSIFDALKARRTYATTGIRMLFEFRVNGSLMGSEIPAAKSPEIYIRVVGTEDISNIRLMRDGCSVKEWDNLGCSAAIKYIDESLTNDLMKMPHYYYAVIAYANDEMAWSSPVFLG